MAPRRRVRWPGYLSGLRPIRAMGHRFRTFGEGWRRPGPYRRRTFQSCWPGDPPPLIALLATIAVVGAALGPVSLRSTPARCRLPGGRQADEIPRRSDWARSLSTRPTGCPRPTGRWAWSRSQPGRAVRRRIDPQGRVRRPQGDRPGQSRQAGARLAVESAYRSYATQVWTFASWVHKGGLGAALETSARPGHSEHQLGTTIDFKTAGAALPGCTSTGRTAREGAWLRKNAWKYGFVMSYPKGKKLVTCYAYEPWHYRYVGRELAGPGPCQRPDPAPGPLDPPDGAASDADPDAHAHPDAGAHTHAGADADPGADPDRRGARALTDGAAGHRTGPSVGPDAPDGSVPPDPSRTHTRLE